MEKFIFVFREFFSACDESESDDDGDEDSCDEEHASEEVIATHPDGDKDNEDMKWLDNYFASFGDEDEVGYSNQS